MVEVQLHDKMGFLETLGERVFIPRKSEWVYSEVLGRNSYVSDVIHQEHRIVLIVI